jgi:hypothetical protein
MKITVERGKFSWGDFFISQSGTLYQIVLLFADINNTVTKETCAIVRFNTGEVIAYVDQYEIDKYLDDFEEKYGQIRKVTLKEMIFE